MTIHRHQKFHFLVLTAVLLLGFNSSWATDDVKICIKYETHFTDWAMGDFYASSSPHDYIAIRPHVLVWDNDSNIPMFNYFTDDVNCTPTLALNSAHDFEIKVYAEALLVDGNVIRVYDNIDNPIIHAQVVHPNWNPPGDGPFPFTHQYNYNFKVSNILAAAGWTVNRRPGGLSNLDITYFTDPCPSTGSSCFQTNGGDHRIMLSLDDRDRKSTIAHETGHEIAYTKKGNDESVSDCSFYINDSEDCSNGDTGATSHCNKCVEHQSCAAWEGFADFYMVAAWNYEGDNNCDYNDDGDSCAVENHWMEDYSCLFDYDGYGMEWDWTHFWWEMYSNRGYSVGDIAQIYNLSDPEDWFDVYIDLRSAAIDFGKSFSIWDTWADFNGVDH
ncbi:MAG: hypothetical protein IT350_10805 [Deltaproteobacteria bacterium]|nr:hypothetical protein [Deltaproteobacteria bacterium]